jgi:glutamine synthetase adenylyltransferase
MELAKRAWRRAGQSPELVERIDNMLERIRRERGTGFDLLDLKTGRGGIIEAEFFVQALQMRKNVWEQNWERAVDRLHEHAQLDDSATDQLKRAYALLRRCELVLRRYDNRSVSSLPGDPTEQRKFIVRLGYKDVDTFHRDYVGAREAIHSLYQRLLTSAWSQ